jgi:hypothetical protein
MLGSRPEQEFVYLEAALRLTEGTPKRMQVAMITLGSDYG